jgi:hypothetical protein
LQGSKNFGLKKSKARGSTIQKIFFGILFFLFPSFPFSPFLLSIARHQKSKANPMDMVLAGNFGGTQTTAALRSQPCWFCIRHHGQGIVLQLSPPPDHKDSKPQTLVFPHCKLERRPETHKLVAYELRSLSYRAASRAHRHQIHVLTFALVGLMMLMLRGTSRWLAGMPRILYRNDYNLVWIGVGLTTVVALLWLCQTQWPRVHLWARLHGHCDAHGQYQLDRMEFECDQCQGWEASCRDEKGHPIHPDLRPWKSVSSVKRL